MNLSLSKKEGMFALFVIALFLAVKLPAITFRFSDGNAYIYMAQMILGGNLPYRDFFLADPPAMVLILTLLKFIFGTKIILFQAAPIILEAATAVLLFLILKKRNNALAFLAPFFYLFSFTILATSDFLTGVQFVSFFVVWAIFLWEKNRPLASGIIWSLAFLSKLYVAPVLLGFGIFIFWKKDYSRLIRITLGAVMGTVIILGPFLALAPEKIIDSAWLYHFNKPAGLNKYHVFSFLLQKEWLLILWGIIGMFISKNKKVGAMFLASVTFLLVFKDIYYNYFGLLLPFLVILTLDAGEKLYVKIKNDLRFMTVTFILLALFLSATFIDYRSNFADTGKFLNLAEIASYIKTLPANTELYGSYEFIPLVALESNRKIFNNYIDTNTQVFSTGTIDLEAVSNEAATKGVFMLAKIADWPELGIKDQGFQGYFSDTVFKKFCQREKTFVSTSGETDNLIAIYYCHKN